MPTCQGVVVVVAPLLVGKSTEGTVGDNLEEELVITNTERF